MIDNDVCVQKIDMISPLNHGSFRGPMFGSLIWKIRQVQFHTFQSVKFNFITVLWIALLVLLTSPARADGTNSHILVFAASSMTSALNQIVDSYTLDTGKKVKVSYGASSALARQLTYGAPADVYISANERWMRYAIKNNAMQANTVVPWLKNDLVLIAQKGKFQPFQLTRKNVLKALGKGRLAIGDPSHVPAGIYARESLSKLRIWNSLVGKFALSNSVRATLALVERGEAPLGVVYLSDARASKQVEVISTFPEETHSPIVFSMGLTKDAKPDAQRFYQYLRGTKAIDIVQANGFILPIGDTGVL